jgi:hypothetical protein
MSAIAHKTKPVAIKRPALKKTDQYIGTCRSYDEQQPIPSFVRRLTPKNSSAVVNTTDDKQQRIPSFVRRLTPKNSSAVVNTTEKDTEETTLNGPDTQKCSHITGET